MSSPSPSSSAVTIPIPGRSILKRPPPTPVSLFSRITRFLPTTPTSPAFPPSPSSTTNSSSDGKPTPPEDPTRPVLKRAHFILPEIAIVYPISSQAPPSTPSLKEEKRAIEERERERRRRVVRGASNGSVHSGGTTATSTSRGGGSSESISEDWWSMDKVESFYREVCAGYEEEPDPAITVALKHASPSSPRTVDFSGVQLTPVSASILSDVFTIEWGLRKVVFKECDLDEHTLKPMLHALLIPNSLSFLSVASNRRLKTPAFRLIGAYVKNAKSLQFLDLSQNTLDKKAIEYIVAALTTPPEQGIVSLRLDDCALRPAALETLCRAVRTSSLRNISLRHNRISAAGGVAIALMIRDYPDVVPIPTPLSLSQSQSSYSSLSSANSYNGNYYSPSIPGTPTTASSASSSPTGSVAGLPPISGGGGPTPTATPSTPQFHVKQGGGPPPPPPRHPPLGVGVQTTYTPYIPRTRRKPAGTGSVPGTPLNATGGGVPLITSSTSGGVTMRHGDTDHNPNAKPRPQHGHEAGPSAALLDKVRALDSLPRLGALRTLDLRGNDLRTGITYIAQVLKRNRTLKVLNLSENKLDVQCLVTIAEALKYNSSLETLDLNKNPCSGPGLEGIQSLRTAFTINTALKRLFLSSTSMTSAGAIALAEFLPESTSLLHLDLTNNNLDLAGVMALSSGLKANHVMRCMDVNIPPGDEEFARMCREILNSCVRNTEEAERITTKSGDGSSVTSGRGLGKGVWGMIEESELAKFIKLDEEKKIDSDVVVRAQTCIAQLTSVISGSSTPTASAPNPNSEDLPPLAEIEEKANSVVEELGLVIQETEDPARLEELFSINDQLLSLLQKVPGKGQGENGRPSLRLEFDENRHIAEAVNGSPNGHSVIESDEEEVEEEEATTPRIDKGKRRAEPEPEEPEKVLSPTFLIAESSSDEEEGDRFIIPPEATPTDRSRSWVEEEGEVFRKGTILLGPEEMEGDYAGDDLRKELLEAMVERPPPRPVTDDFGMEIIPGAGDFDNEHHKPLFSTASASSPVTEQSPKIAPRPYISRSKSSSNSILSLISPTPSEPEDASSPVSMKSPTSPTILAAVRPFVTRSRSTSNVETA